MKNLPKVAIIGRPNVGKSTLFNVIIEKQKSIVDDIPGVTRDRLIAEIDYYGKNFQVIDTGGYEDGVSEMAIHVQEQIRMAVKEADVLIFVVDGKTGLMTEDLEISKILRKSTKKTIVAVNKVDNQRIDYSDFYKAGFKLVFPISAMHKIGIGDFLDEVTSTFEKNIKEGLDPIIPKICISGRPNTGKSTLMNAILGEKRVVTSAKPGTTRDSIEVLIEKKYGTFKLIDTAGVRRHSKAEGKLELFSITRSKTEIKQADLALLMIDANEGVTQQDKRVAEIINSEGTACVILMNKSDLKKIKEKEIYNELKFLSYAPMLAISAKYDKDFSKIFKKVNLVLEERKKKISTNSLNAFLKKAVNYKTHPLMGTKEVKLKYMVQGHGSGPKFIIFTNHPDLIADSYKRFLIRRLREEYGFIGNPIDIGFKNKDA